MDYQNTIFHSRRNRRGVLLLVSLVLLALFLMLGTTFIIMSRVDKTCRGINMTFNWYQKITEDAGDGLIGISQLPEQRLPPPLPGAGASFFIDYPFDEGRDPRGPYTYGVSSLLNDKYGDSYITQSVAVPGNARLGNYVTPLATSFPFVEIRFSGFGIVGSTNPNHRSLDGRIIALVNNSQKNAVYRIITEIADGRYLAHPVNPEAVIDLSSVIKQLTPTVLGREFTGDPLEDDLNESYDVADRRNFSFAWVQPEAHLGRDHVPDASGISSDKPSSPSRYIVPSFHRPDHLLAVLKEENGDGQIALERWLGYDRINGFSGSSMLELMRPMGQMQWATDIDWSDYGLSDTPSLPNVLPHPNFTGSNPNFDPINGPWDVDNDGDGIADSVWIDIGTKPITIDGTICKPLVAIMLIDLDGRINLNAHGNTAPDTYGDSPVAPLPDVITTGIRYAGSDAAASPAIETHAAPGQGWGVADIDPVLLLEAGGKMSINDLLSGTEATAGGQTASGIDIPELKTEGRYGDSVAGSGSLTPTSGRRDVNDASVDAETGTLARDHYRPDEYGVDTSDNRRSRTPVDVWGSMTVAQDQYGQPFFARPNDTDAWEKDRVDDPYDLSLGRTAPRPSGHYDPNVPASPNETQDNLFSPTHLARLLNLYDREYDGFSGRLTGLLGNAAEVARLTATTESWDTPAVTVPLHTLNKILALTDQAFGSSDSLVSWDVQMGIRMDINRPFGNGLDDDGDGIVDEPGENEAGYYGNLGPYATTNLCNGRDLNVYARQLFARHLYCLTRVLCPSLGAAEVAQFAVNVVDFRDSDSIMTRFQYDKNFTDGSTDWAVDASSPVVWGCERPELLITEVLSWRNITESGSAAPYNYVDNGTGGLIVELYHPWTGQTNNGQLSQAIPAEIATNPAECLDPATSSIDLAKTHNGQGDGSPVFQLVVAPNTSTSKYELVSGDKTWGAAKTDAQARGGQLATITSNAEYREMIRQLGGPVPDAWIGLMVPVGSDSWQWDNSEPVRWTHWASGDGLPESSHAAVVSSNGWRSEATGTAYPYILETTTVPSSSPTAADALLADPTWPTDPAKIARVIYLGKTSEPTALLADATNQQWMARDYSTKTEHTDVAPGQTVLIGGPADLGAGLFVHQIAGQTADVANGLAMVVDQACEVRTMPEAITIGFDDDAEETPMALTAGLKETLPGGLIPDPDNTPAGQRPEEYYRKTAKRFPLNADYGPVGALICCEEVSGSVAELRLPPSSLLDTELLEWIDGAESQFLVLLRRLADPTQPFHAATNPYLTIDSMGFHEQAVIGPHPVDSSGVGPITLTSIERGTGQILDPDDPNFENDIWRQSGDMLNTSGSYTTNNVDFYNYCGKRSSTATILSSLGFRPSPLKIPAVGAQDESPWPWFAWLDREFTSLGELLLVPGSAPGTLLRDHTTHAPFGSLFFGGGSPAAPSDPAQRLGILEFLRVPSRFADAEQPISTADAVAVSDYLEGKGGKPLYLPPHNYVSHFREPGRVNLNTLASPLVWKAIDGRYQTNVYEDEGRFDTDGNPVTFTRSSDWTLGAGSPYSGNWRADPNVADGNEPAWALNDDHDNNNLQAVSGDDGGETVLKSIVASRHGWAPPGNNVSDAANPTVAAIAGSFDRVLNRAAVEPGGGDRTLWFDRPFQSGWRMVGGLPVFDPNYSLLIRRERASFAALAANDTKAIEFLFRPDADPAHHRPHAEPSRNPYFWYRDIIRYANKVGCRSNVFAAWTTVGFFTLDENERLSAEYVDSSGNRIRTKRFQIIDRSLPVGYNPIVNDDMNAIDVEAFQFYQQ